MHELKEVMFHVQCEPILLSVSSRGWKNELRVAPRHFLATFLLDMGTLALGDKGTLGDMGALGARIRLQHRHRMRLVT